MIWSKVQSRKYKGETLPQILFVDPGYFFWSMDSDAFKRDEQLYEQAKLVDFRAWYIKSMFCVSRT